MENRRHTVLITGGGTGIGLAFARRFMRDGHRVIICGRRVAPLAAAEAAMPGLMTRVCDCASEEERVGLASWALGTFPDLDMLMNNAGIQVRGGLPIGRPWKEVQEEIAVNLEAPIHLSMLFAGQFAKRDGAAIVNVTSGLAFAPMAHAPVYCATKAALHSFTLSLRHELSATGVRVVEVIPPAVNTDLGGAGIHTHGTPLEEFADAAYAKLVRGEEEIGYGFSERSRLASRQELEEMFRRMNPPREAGGEGKRVG